MISFLDCAFGNCLLPLLIHRKEALMTDQFEAIRGQFSDVLIERWYRETTHTETYWTLRRGAYLGGAMLVGFMSLISTSNPLEMSV